jgi:tripartite-type tricarboxylate transporter receptor subunit TctC
MNLPRRRFLELATGAAALSVLPRIAMAQAYPTRPVRIIIGFAAGGTPDVFTRLIGQRLSQQFGQPVVVENKAGVASNLAAASVVRSPPDGYTLLLLTAVNSYNTALYSNLGFDILRDLVPVASIVSGIGVMVVNPNFAATTLPDFISYAKANPGQLNMASSGVGTSQHVYGALFLSSTGINMLHVPYRGGAAALTDLMAGRVSVMFDTLATSIEYIRTGRLRALAVTSPTRSEFLPDVPAIAEYVPGYAADGWQGMAAPTGTPIEIIDRLNKEVNAGLAEPEIRARIADLGYSPFSSTPAEFSRFVAGYTEKWAKIIRAADIKAE